MPPRPGGPLAGLHPALVGRHAAPDAVALVGVDGVVEALQPDQIVANAEAGLTIDVSKETLQTSKQVAGSFMDEMQDRFNRKGTLS